MEQRGDAAGRLKWTGWAGWDEKEARKETEGEAKLWCKMRKGRRKGAKHTRRKITKQEQYLCQTLEGWRNKSKTDIDRQFKRAVLFSFWAFFIYFVSVIINQGLVFNQWGISLLSKPHWVFSNPFRLWFSAATLTTKSHHLNLPKQIHWCN